MMPICISLSWFEIAAAKEHAVRIEDYDTAKRLKVKTCFIRRHRRLGPVSSRVTLPLNRRAHSSNLANF
jgi:hypothetical protein